MDMAENELDETRKQTMIKVAQNCKNISERPVQTFHEAVQSTWFLFVILQMESNASSFSPGRLDRHLEAYYEKDIKEGTLDKQQALEIIECLWLKFNEIVYMRNSHGANILQDSRLDLISRSEVRMRMEMIHIMIYHSCS